MIKLIKLFVVSTLMLTPITFTAKAGELNLPGFTGTMNTTVSSGITFRAEDVNCMLQDGRDVRHSNAALEAAGLASGFSDASVGLNTKWLSFSATAQANIKSQNKNSAGCATAQTDGYGNTSYNALPLGDVNSDNGSLNFRDSGDVVDATQKMFSEITGTTDAGLGVNLSFIASVNPVLDLNGPSFYALTSDAKEELESDFTLLDAYVTTSLDTGDNGFVDVTAGRFVTSWGEATFIPIGLNGMVTNAIDLSKLRAPGASIRDALIPTGQITLASQFGDWSIEGYMQFEESHLELDPKGAFFGSDTAGTGATRLLASGSYQNEGFYSSDTYCTYAYNEIGNAGAGNTCNQASANIHTADATREYYDTAALAQNAQIGASAVEWATYAGTGAAVDFGSAETGAAFEVTNGLAPFTTAAAGAAALASNIYTTANLVPWDGTKAATVELLTATDGLHKYASSDGQFGLAARTYLADIGTGVDLGFYYSNYHSKVPYFQAVGKGGVLAGDHVGAYISAGYGPYALGSLAVLAKDVPTVSANGTITSADQFALALLNGAMSSGVCGGFTGIGLGALGGTTAGTLAHQNSKSNAASIRFGVELDDGTVAHDPTPCDVQGKAHTGTTLAFIGYGATLLPAITPLNYATYEFIYPEDIQVLGASFNTNVGGTTVQGELAYRPDYPLAITAGDQINAISDASGATAALTMFAAQSYGGADADKIGALVAFEGLVNAVCASGCGTGTNPDGTTQAITTFDQLLTYNERSSTGGAVYSATNDYRAKAYHDDMDVISIDIGTTTSFTASDPITVGLGADSAFLLTELGIVHIDGMDDINKGFVSRNGAVEGNGGHLCLGFAQKMSAAQRAAVNTAANTAGAANTALDAYSPATMTADNFSDIITLDNTLEYDSAGLTNMGANITDALFGNGNYCESQPGADATSMSYRLVGGASYNNFNNSTWSLSPNFAWSHDFSGYGPSSLGGFVEGRQSLSVGVTANKGAGVSASLNYVAQMGDEKANVNGDKDYVSASVSYGF